MPETFLLYGAIVLLQGGGGGTKVVFRVGWDP